MARVKFKTDAHPESKFAWGYAIEHTADGIFGEVPDDMLDNEIAAGRVEAPVQAPKVGRPRKDADIF